MTDRPYAPQTGRIAFVTGASRGIGRACALGLAKAGAHVIACARSKASLEELDDAIFAATGQHATLIPYDLTDFDSTDRLPQALSQRFGRIDVLVHAAALLGALSPVTHHEPKDFERIMRVNLFASWRLIRALDPLLRASSAARALFFTTGPSVVEGRAFWGPYGASKAALESLVRAWADEIEISSVRTAIIDPGAMRTKMRASAYPGEDPESLPHPDAIVPLVLNLADPEQMPPKTTVHFKDWQPASQSLNAAS
jgi:NAD(P)-dependent dehydrogenase (short-subunit alcohol dehydrogenase family)